MYVLIIGRGYPSEKYKMNGIFEFDQAKALHKIGVKVVYAAVDVRSIRRWRNWGFEKKVVQEVSVYNLNIPLGRVPKVLKNKISSNALRKLYRRIVREQGVPDVIHAHFIGVGYPVANAFKDLGIPLVLTEHYSAMNQSKLSNYYLQLGQLTYPKMDKVIAVSQALARNLNEKFGICAQVIPNVVDLTNFSYEAMSGSIEKENFTFISVGNLKPNKRMDRLIVSFKKAFESDHRIRLYIYGEGTERENLEKLISEIDLTDRIVLKGMQSRSVIAEQMKVSDGFVLVSESETFGLVYIEALACGLPVIATKCGGPEDFINDRNGVLIPVNDESELVKALQAIVRQDSGYDKQLISSEIKEKYSEERFTVNLTGLYEEVIRSKVRP